MFSKRLGGLCAAIGLAFGLGGCVDDYGYGGVQVGYGGGYYGDPYYDGYGYGYGAVGPSYYGWYGDYYYPGTGIYVYDRYRRPFRWNDGQRRYWSAQQRYRGRDWDGRGSWNGFDRTPGAGGVIGGNRQWQGRPGQPDRQWQGQPGQTNRQWQGRPGQPDRQWQRDRSDVAPGAQRFREGARPGGFDGNRGTAAPTGSRNPGGWSGRGGGRSGRRGQ